MAPRLSTRRFVLRNALVWILMVAILVVVPGQLERWLSVEISRVIGWPLACGVWVVAVEREWQARFGPFARFGFQLLLWVSAALCAVWLSDQLQPR
ncbi:MAG TPA: hypothetical protein VLT86_01980 [Vicinamibacterales bacterium]|nr:hypothetical protein [Vicinamibacterales bacterium]